MGVAFDYHAYLLSPVWKQKAREAKDRAGWQCALCPARSELEAHHRTYERIGHERPDDLVVLCHQCHQRHRGQPKPQLQLPLAGPRVVVVHLRLRRRAAVPTGAY